MSYTFKKVADASTEYFNDRTSSEVFANKYALRSTPEDFEELTPDDMHHRLASEFARMEVKFGGDRQLSKETIYNKLKDFKYIVPQGSPMTAIGNNYSVMSASNCTVIQSPEDSLTSIMLVGTEMALLMKRRAGVGIDISKLRPCNSPVKNAAIYSSGAHSFSDYYSYITRMIGQKGRQGALMVTMDIAHPDSPKFATIKHDLTKVTGANISLRITDEFMKAVINDKDFLLRWPINSDNPIITNSIKAKDLFQTIVDSAHKTGDPGLLMWNNYISNLPAHCYDDFKTVSTNPCFTGDMKLRTSNGFFTLKELWEKSGKKKYEPFYCEKYMCDNQLIVNQNGNTVATCVYQTSERSPIYEVKLCNGQTIKATSNHRFILDNGERKILSELKIGDKLPLNLVEKFGNFDNPDYGVLAGWVIGDGLICYRNNQMSAIVKGWNNDIFEVLPILQKSMLNLSNKKGKSGTEKYNINIKKPKGFNYITGKFQSLILGKLLNEDGLCPGNKHKVPKSILYSNKDTISAFLRGLYSADGSVQAYDKNATISIRIAQTNKLLLEEIQLLLSQFGIKSKIFSRRKAGDQYINDGKGNKRLYKKKELFGLIISGRKHCKKFINEIGFIQRYKMQSALNWFSKHPGSNDSSVPENTVIKSIEYIGDEPTYCLTEPIANEICINGIVIGQCAEIGLSAYDSCRLISINLTSYVENSFTNKAKFNLKQFEEDVRIAQRLSDDLVELELELIGKIIESCTDDIEKNLWQKMLSAAVKGRRTGLGTHGLGDTLARLGLKYDSDTAHQRVHMIYKTFRDSAYLESIELAKERGAFPVWNWEQEKKCKFFKRLPNTIIETMKKHGRRNISLLTCAPTGSVSMMSKTSSGIEPIFRLQYMRRIKVYGNDNIKIDFIDEVGEKWHHYSIFHHTFQQYLNLNKILIDPTKSLKEQKIKIPEFFTTSENLDYMQNVKMIGIIQSYIDHGVSCTINMPQKSTSDMVKNVYIDAWKRGMKGVTVYIEGSKSGVLVSDDDEQKQTNIKYSHAPKRPKNLPCEIHITKCQGKRWLVIVGMFAGKPYEVFAGKACDLPMPRDINKAIIRKTDSRKYTIVYEEEGEEIFVPIKESFMEGNGMLVRLLINQSIRHGVPLETLYDTVGKSSDMNDFSRTVVRILKKYINEESDYKMKCLNCKSDKMRLIEGCYQCELCGFSKCT